MIRRRPDMIVTLCLLLLATTSKCCPETDVLLHEIDDIMFPESQYFTNDEEEISIWNDIVSQIIIQDNSSRCSSTYNLQEEKLVLSGCLEIPLIDNDNETQVTKAAVTMTDIIILTRNSFMSWSGIKHLEIIDNDKLEKIEGGSFRGMKDLEKLRISNNYKLKIIHEDSFASLINLKELSLNSNGFEKISMITNALRPTYVPTLQSLDIIGNPFFSIHQADFIQIEQSNITSLYLGVKELNHLGTNPLINLINLKKFGFSSEYPSNNDVQLLKSINDNMSLTHVSFQDIDTLEKSEIFINTLTTPFYESVKFQRSRIREIRNEWFSTAFNLKEVDISYSVFDDFPTALFNPFTFPVIEKIILRYNRFKHIPFMMLTSPVELLDLAGNHFISLRENSFDFAPDLKVLIITHKSIQNIDKNAFAANMNLIFLDLRENDFHESSKLFNNETFTGLQNLQALDMSFCKIKEFHHSDVFANLINLKYLSLESNKIEYIDNEWFTPTKCLNKLDLRNNYFIHLNPSLFKQNYIDVIGLFSKIYKVDDDLIRWLGMEKVVERIVDDLDDCSEVTIVDSKSKRFAGENNPTMDKCTILINRYNKSLVAYNNSFDETTDDSVYITNTTITIDDSNIFEFICILFKPRYVYNSLSNDTWSILRFLYVFSFYLIMFGVITFLLFKLVGLIRKYKKKKRPGLMIYEEKVDYCGVENKGFNVPYEKMKE